MTDNLIGSFLPTDLYGIALKPKKLLSIGFIKSAPAANGSPFYYLGGFLDWLQTGGYDALELAKMIFQPQLAYQLATILTLYLKLRDIQASRRELPSGSEEEIIQQLGIVIYTKDQKHAVEYFNGMATHYGRSDPRGLLYTAVVKHLAGFAPDANILFRRFEKAYDLKSQTANALVQHRFGKSLAATGDFKRALSRYQKTLRCRGLPAMVRTQAAREYCNVATQMAWDFPRNRKGWVTLQEAVTNLSEALIELKAYRGNQSEQSVIRFLTASRDEFAVLAESRGVVDRNSLKEIKRAIDRQCKKSLLTGRNRNTQLAAAYLRIGEFDTAIQTAVRFQKEITDPLERGLTHLVQGQAYLGVNKEAEAKNAIENAVKHFDQTSTTRFRRVAAIYKANMNPQLDVLGRVASYLWPMKGQCRHVGAFVPAIPKLHL